MSRPVPPRWAKLAVWLGLAGVAWLGVAVVVVGFALWPWPTAVAAALGFGVVIGVVWAHRPMPDVELVHKRKDLAIDAAMGTAFKLQALEHPVTDDTGPGTIAHLRSGEQPAIYDQDTDRSFAGSSYRARLS